MNQPSGEERKSKFRHDAAVRFVQNDILNGATYSVILNKLVDDAYGLGHNYSPTNGQKIITKARKILKEDYKELVPQMRETLTNICMDILTEARESGDRANAIKAVQEVAKITGAYQPEQREITVKELTIDFNLLDNESKP